MLIISIISIIKQHNLVLVQEWWFSKATKVTAIPALCSGHASEMNIPPTIDPLTCTRKYRTAGSRTGKECTGSTLDPNCISAQGGVWRQPMLMPSSAKKRTVLQVMNELCLLYSGNVSVQIFQPLLDVRFVGAARNRLRQLLVLNLLPITTWHMAAHIDTGQRFSTGIPQNLRVPWLPATGYAGGQ